MRNTYLAVLVLSLTACNVEIDVTPDEVIPDVVVVVPDDDVVVVPDDEFTSLTISWEAPLTNEDGTELTNLAGYNIYYTSSSSEESYTVTINNPSVTKYVIDNMSIGSTYSFTMTAFNLVGSESERTDITYIDI